MGEVLGTAAVHAKSQYIDWANNASCFEITRQAKYNYCRYTINHIIVHVDLDSSRLQKLSSLFSLSFFKQYQWYYYFAALLGFPKTLI